MNWASAPMRAVERADPAMVVLQAMLADGTRHRGVTEPDGSLFGVVSLRDLLADDVARRPDVRTDASVRSERPHTLAMEATLGGAIGLMNGQRIGCVPLVDPQQRPVAVVTRSDVMRAVAATLPGR